MKKIPIKGEPDCTHLGKWLLWVILALVLGGFLAYGCKSNAQGLLGGAALLGASAPSPQVTQPGAVPVVVVPGDCDGDISPSTSTADGLIIAPIVVADLGAGQTIVGTSGGAGTSNSPISLAAALNFTATAVTAPGARRKLYLRAGTYRGRYNDVQLQGSAANPWIIQPCPGDVAVLNQRSDTFANGSTTTHINFINNAAYIEMRNLEFTDNLYNPVAADGEDANYRGGIKVDDASNITFENCIIHDQTGSGVLTGSTDARNITIRGCLFYNLGTASNIKHHGVYLYNEFFASPNNSRHIVDGNIFINFTAWGIHLYATSTGIPVSGIYCSNNIIRDSGGNRGSFTLWDGHTASVPGDDVRFVNNGISQAGSLQYVKLQSIKNAILHSNYLQLGAGQLRFQSNYTAVSFKSNVVVSTHADAIYALNDYASWATLNPAFDWNTYKLSDGNPFSVNGGNNDWTTWRSTTGDDVNSTISTSTTTGLTIKYVPNRLDTNLVYFAIFNEASAGTVDIDLRTFWPAPCGTYEIRNAGSYAGALASSGAWTGQSAITITMTGQNYTEAWHGDGPTWTQSTTFFVGIAKRIRAN